MSIIVKGMQMPEECEVCPTRHFYTDTGKTICMLTHATLAENYDTGIAFVRHENCPLVELPEKHGRLIDADKLFDAMKYSNWKVLFSSDGTFLDISKFSEIIRNIPTVVEAEGEE